MAWVVTRKGSATPANLRQSELERVVAWFTHHMDLDQRRRLMADLPQQYAKLYPDVDADVIADAVRYAIRERRGSKSG
jgi:hypothetical protein